MEESKEINSSNKLGTSVFLTNFQRILKMRHYKLQQLHHMTEDDPNHRAEIYNWFFEKFGSGHSVFIHSNDL